MEIDKKKIVDMLKGKGENDKAQQADSDLPDKVDTEKDKSMLDKLGIDPSELMGGFSL